MWQHTSRGSDKARLTSSTSCVVNALAREQYRDKKETASPLGCCSMQEQYSVRWRPDEAWRACAVWETERLTMAYDPENRFAGLLMFFDTEGGRRIITVGGGPVIPKYGGV